jgi:hypothetical protein
VGQGRVIQPGQLIHASVAFKRGDRYTPKAEFPAGMKGKSWEAIIGQGHKDDIGWADDLKDFLEMDLFDHSQAQSLIDDLSQGKGNASDSLKRLSHFALYGMFLFYLCATWLVCTYTAPAHERGRSKGHQEG